MADTEMVKICDQVLIALEKICRGDEPRASQLAKDFAVMVAEKHDIQWFQMGHEAQVAYIRLTGHYVLGPV